MKQTSAPAHTPTELEVARKLIEDMEVWLVLGIARDASPKAIQNAIDMHDRLRDFLGEDRVNWSDYVAKSMRVLGA